MNILVKIKICKESTVSRTSWKIVKVQLCAPRILYYSSDNTRNKSRGITISTISFHVLENYTANHDIPTYLCGVPRSNLGSPQGISKVCMFFAQSDHCYVFVLFEKKMFKYHSFILLQIRLRKNIFIYIFCESKMPPSIF